MFDLTDKDSPTGTADDLLPQGVVDAYKEYLEHPDLDDAGPDYKMVIVMRTDLNMRRGKQIAQGGHAVLMAIIKPWIDRMVDEVMKPHGTIPDSIPISQKTITWLVTGMTKICVQVGSESDLLAIESKAKTAGIACRIVVDAGRTEFHNEPTLTCLAIGPDKSEQIDAITGHLKLL